MAEPDSPQDYRAHVARLKQGLEQNEALRDAIGGEYVAVGMLEYSLLLSLGLADHHRVIDVGCGAGRLAYQLAARPGLRYAGTDVVQDLLDYAQRVAGRPDWSFQLAEGTRIPGEDGSADFVCFFSVFTHLVHEQTFYYLQEAKRVLKPGGRIVFSFLEFRIPCHWDVFEHSVQNSGSGLPLNQFMDRDGIRAWAKSLGLKVDLLVDGDKPHIPLSNDITWEDGRVMSGLGNLGQSVAVLSLPGKDPLQRLESKPAVAPARAHLRTWSPVLEDKLGRGREQRIAELTELARTRALRIFELDAERRNLRAMWTWRLLRLERKLRRFFARRNFRSR